MTTSRRRIMVVFLKLLPMGYVLNAAIVFIQRSPIAHPDNIFQKTKANSIWDKHCASRTLPTGTTRAKSLIRAATIVFTDQQQPVILSSSTPLLRPSGISPSFVGSLLPTKAFRLRWHTE